MPRKPLFEESIAGKYPEEAKEWNYELNEIGPDEVFPGTNKKYWWKCDKGVDHVWDVSPNKRCLVGRKCPICSNQKVVLSNCLATTHPHLAKEWHPILNDKTPYEVVAGSNKKVWWKCPEGEDHEWLVAPNHRKGCPICSNQKIVKSNCLETTHPELARQWDSEKNEITPRDVVAGSNKPYWWKCDKGDDHKWRASPSNRTLHDSGCPICTNQKIVDSNCLATTNPELLNEWHYDKNRNINPLKISIGSKQKVWWRCASVDSHIWSAVIYSRTISGCPYCSNRKVDEKNSLATTHPEIAKEWHPIKNVDLTTDDVVVGSGKYVWWKCSKGDDHEWKTSIVHRKNGSSCPFCTLTPQSRQELTITFELLKIFKGIDPKGFKTRIDGKIWSIDIYIPKIHIGIEFDGSYWHKDKAQLDKVKTEKIEQTGLNLIRVRQKPLKRLFEDDVMAEEKFDGKQITNDILKQIVKDNGRYSYTLDKRTLNKIDNYLSREGLQNEKGLDKYIDQILTEKAERKK